MGSTDQRFLDIYEKELKDYNTKLKEREDEIKKKEEEKKVHTDKIKTLQFDENKYKDDISDCTSHAYEPKYSDSDCKNLVRSKNVPEGLAQYAKRSRVDYGSCSITNAPWPINKVDHTIWCKYPDFKSINELEDIVRKYDDDIKNLRNKEIIKPELNNIIIQTCNNNSNCTGAECENIKQSCDQRSKTEKEKEVSTTSPIFSNNTPTTNTIPPAFAGKGPDDISKPLPQDMNFNINYIYIGTTVFMIILIIIIIILYLSKKSK
jgi:hypothetical protein